ncbi:MAG TPA: hypothetical protein VLR49_10045 [Ferruginibacter sp.]|nr:hypothetical protein [Ferruginibacter sp.]
MIKSWGIALRRFVEIIYFLDDFIIDLNDQSKNILPYKVINISLPLTAFSPVGVML